MFNRLFTNSTVTYFDPRTQAHKQRVELYGRLWNYYEGKHERPLKPTRDGVDDNVIVNLSKQIVDESVSFLFGKPLTFEVDSNVDERTAEELYLDDIWESDPISGFSQEDFLQELGQMGAITGHAFVRLYIDEGNQPRKPVVLDTGLVDVIVNEDNRKQVDEYHVIWKSGKTYTGRDVWKRHRIIRLDNGTWEIHQETNSGGSKWEMEGDPTPWEYTFPPVLHCQNIKNAKSFWGFSDLNDADMNDAINLVTSDINRIVRFHASPKTIVTGATVADMTEITPHTMWSIKNDAAKAYNLEMSSELAASTGHKQNLKDEFYAVSSTPNISPSNVQVGALSGFALRILYSPLINKTNSKRTQYGGLLQRLNHAFLVIGGFENTSAEIKWMNPLPTDETEQATKFQTYVSSGVPLDIAAELAGLPKEKTEGLAAVQQMNELAKKIEMLERLSQTANLGAAVRVIFADDIKEQPQLIASLVRTDTIIEGEPVRGSGEDTPENISSAKGLNGAQIKAAVDLLAGVNAGTVAELNAIELLTSLGIEKDRAERMAKAAKTQKEVPMNASGQTDFPITER